MFTSDKKILELAAILKSTAAVDSDKEFCEIIEIDPGNFAKIKKSENYPQQNYHFTSKHIENVCKKLGINANWIFDLSTEMYNKSRSLKKSTSTSKTI